MNNEHVNDKAIHVRLIELLQQIDLHAGTHLPSEQEGLSRDQTLVLALFANCRSVLRGTIFLLREDHGHEATILMRTLLQDATTIFYVFKNQPTTGEMTVRFDLGSLHKERLILEEAEKHAPDKETEAALTEVDEHLKETTEEAIELGMDNPKPLPSMAQLFTEVGLPEGYYFFRYASHAVHTSRLALWARMKELPDGRVTINFGGTPETVQTVGLFSGELFLNVYRATAQLLAWSTRSEIEAFVQNHQESFLNLRREAGVTTQGFGQPES